MVEDVPGSKYQTNNYQVEGISDQVQVPRLTVHDDFVETFGMTLAAGRGYSREFPADTLASIMVNQAFVDQMGWGTADDAIGKQITFFGGPGGPAARSVVGVFNDFHYASLHSDVGAFVVERYNSRQATNFFGRYLAIRIAPEDVEGTLAFLEDQWDRYETSRAFEYFFLDDNLDAMYKAEATLGKVATTFSILAILVACLGLFGMASFTAERRTKEIGVRKVMGASVPKIIMLLSRESIQLVGLAFLVAAPLAWFTITAWLESFSYHIDPTIVPMVAAGIVVLLISWFTVSAQSIKAASVEPVESLRYE
jgi:putative ABC transport system permease protein